MCNTVISLFFLSSSQCTDKKENEILLIYKEIQMGSFAKSYMKKGFLIYEEIPQIFNHIWEGRYSYMNVHFATDPFWISLYMGKIVFFLFISALIGSPLPPNV